MSLPTEVAEVLSGARRWCVVHGDCRDVLAGLPRRSVDHVITDPPYSPHVHGKQWISHALTDGGHRKARSKDRGINFEALTDETMAWLSVGAERWAHRWTLAFTDVESVGHWAAAAEVAGLDYVRACIWDKVDSAPQFTGDRPANGAEVFVCVHPKGRKRWSGGGRRNVFRVPVNASEPGGKDHPTQKPLALMLELVSLFSDPGELIIDPFAGSGTTGVAAVRLGRRAILVELDEHYAALARKRMEAEEAGLSLKDARDGQMGLFGPSADAEMAKDSEYHAWRDGR